MLRLRRDAEALRDEGALESAIESAKAAAYYEDADIIRQAALLAVRISQAQSFVDGNKRIAAFLFVWFLERNELLYRKDGSKRLADNALVALTLLIAESKAEEMNMMVKVIVNLINNKN